MMGFIIKSKEEKEIKRLTGGRFLNDDFKEKLKKDQLDVLDGLNIQKQLKKEVKEKKLSLKNIEPRFKELYNEIISQKKDINNAFEYNIKLYEVHLPNEEKDQINKELRNKIFEGKTNIEGAKVEIKEIIKNKNTTPFTNEELEKRKEELEKEEIEKNLNLNFYMKKDNLILKQFECDWKSEYKYNLTVEEYIRNARKFENTSSTENAIIIYEKLINEYKCSNDEPYNRLRFIYNSQKRYEDIIRICDLQIENIGNNGYLNGKNLMIKKEINSEDENKLKVVKNVKKENEIKLKKIKENEEKIVEKERKKSRFNENIEIKKINEKEKDRKSDLIKERDEELEKVKNRYKNKYQQIKSKKDEINTNIKSIEPLKYDSDISSRKINEYKIEIPKFTEGFTGYRSEVIFSINGTLLHEKNKTIVWHHSSLIIYEDGIKIRKKIKFEDIINNSYDKVDNKFYFVMRTKIDKIIFRSNNVQLVNDLINAMENYQSKMINRKINTENEKIYQKEKDKSQRELNNLNLNESDIKKHQKNEEDAIYRRYRKKLHDLNREYDKLREEKIEELIEEEKLKEKKEVENNPKEIEETKEIYKKEDKKTEYQNFITSQGINIPSYDTPYDLVEEEESYGEIIKERKQTDEGREEENIEKTKDETVNETKNMHISSSDNLVLKPFKESLDIEENVKAMQKYDETVLSYNDEGKMLEKNGQIEEAMIIYEKLVNEYKFGGNFPYDRLNAIYYKQNNPKEIIRICNLAIENLGHVGYLRGKELMINPEVTSAGTKEKVKKFKDRKKREEKRLKKSEQKEKEKEKQAQDQEIIEKCANDLELAQRLEEEDKIDEAIKLYETVTKAKYPEKLPYTRLCILYRKKKNYKKELTTCNKAIRNLSNKKQKEWFKERKIKVQEKIDN